MDGSSKRISVVSTDPWLDRLHGASIFELLHSLSTFDHFIEVLLLSSKSLKMHKGSLSITTFRTKENVPIFSYLLFLMRITYHLMRSKPQIMIFDASIMPSYLILRLLGKTKGIMLILSRPLKETGVKAWLHLLQFRLALLTSRSFADFSTAISPFEARVFSRLGKIPESKILILPSPLGKRFSDVCHCGDINELKSRLSLNAAVGKKVLLYHGSLDDRRGVMRVLELFVESCKESDFVFLLVGTGPATDSVKRFIREKGADNIILMNPVPYVKMPELISICDIGLVILPDDADWRYQTPTKLIEFLALEKPVIASDLEGIRWVAGASNLVVYLKSLEHVSVNDFRAALESALALRASDLSFSNSASSQWIIDRFSSHSIAFRLNQTIMSLIEK